MNRFSPSRIQESDYEEFIMGIDEITKANDYETFVFDGHKLKAMVQFNEEGAKELVIKSVDAAEDVGNFASLVNKTGSMLGLGKT